MAIMLLFHKRFCNYREGKLMGNSQNSASDAGVGPVELVFASLLVAIWLATFAFGYWKGRDIGSMLFN
jgi:hypothetical protein